MPQRLILQRSRKSLSYPPKVDPSVEKIERWKKEAAEVSEEVKQQFQEKFAELMEKFSDG